MNKEQIKKVLSLKTRYQDMQRRCAGKKPGDKNNYFDRGIKNNFRNFEEFAFYVLKLPNAFELGFTLDRIDNNKGYEKQNLRWAPPIVQNLNTRHMYTRKILPFVHIYRGSKDKRFRVRIRSRKNPNKCLCDKHFSNELEAFEFALKEYKKLYPKKIYDLIKIECLKIKKFQGK